AGRGREIEQGLPGARGAVYDGQEGHVHCGQTHDQFPGRGVRADEPLAGLVELGLTLDLETQIYKQAPYGHVTPFIWRVVCSVQRGSPDTPRGNCSIRPRPRIYPPATAQSRSPCRTPPWPTGRSKRWPPRRLS